MPAALPDPVLQGLGLAPPPFDSDLAGAPVADAAGAGGPWIGGLHPAVLQGLGLAPPAPPPAAPEPTAPPDQAAGAGAPGPGGEIPAIPPAPQLATELPSVAGRKSAGGTSPTPAVPEQHIPMSAFGGAATGPAGQPTAPPSAPAGPAKPPSVDQQLTNAQQREDQATAEGHVAIGAGLQAKQGENADTLSALQQHDDTTKKIQAELQAEQDDFVKTHAQKQAEADAINKRADNYKIDQNQYWNSLGMGSHIGWYVAMAMSALGNALTGHGGAANPVVSMLQDKIHQNVVAQENERDRLQRQGARLDKEVDRFDQFSQNKQARILMKESEADKMLANQFRIAAAKNADAKDRASAMQQAAQLDQSAADKAQQAAQWAAGYDVQKRQLANAQANTAISAGHLKETVLHNIVTEGLTQEQRDIALMAEQRKESADQKKAIHESAVYNPTTGAPLLNERGQKMLEQAKAFEAQAASDPQNAAQYQAQAKQLRDEANSTEVATIGDKEDRRKVVDGIKYAQDLVDTASKMKAFMANDPGITDRAGWAKLKTELGATIADYAKSLGANASSREFDAISKHVLDFDPNSIISRGARKTPMLAEIDGLIEATRRGVNTSLKSRGITAGWQPSSPDDAPPAPPTAAEKTRQRLLEKPNVSYQTAFQQAQQDELARVRDKYGGSANYAPESEVAAAVRRAGDTAAKYKDVAPDQIRLIQDLKDRAANHDQAAFDALRNIGKDGATQAIRDLAVQSQKAAADEILARQNVSKSFDDGTRSFTPNFNAPAQPTFPR